MPEPSTYVYLCIPPSIASRNWNSIPLTLTTTTNHQSLAHPLNHSLHSTPLYSHSRDDKSKKTPDPKTTRTLLTHSLIHSIQGARHKSTPGRRCLISARFQFGSVPGTSWVVPARTHARTHAATNQGEGGEEGEKEGRNQGIKELKDTS